MTVSTDTTAVRRSVVVDAPIERAFVFFTRDIGAWWDADKHLLQEPLKAMVFEPQVGGHIVDRDIYGTESRWATILAYNPPTHVAFSWNINLRWEIETDPTRTSEVHVTFTAHGERRTLVELEHRHLDRHGDGWEAMRDAVSASNGWDLAPYAREVAAA
ncbi:MAG: SRPBCC family protein [Candidatus Dormibacteria bacterium]